MPQPLSKRHHAGLHWSPPETSWHAARSMLVPVSIAELARAVSLFPLAFVDTGGSPTLHAILGLDEGQCAYVDNKGRWRAPYRPNWLATHPFYLARDEQGQYVVAVDENAPELSTDAVSGEPLFDGNGEPSAGVQENIARLKELARQLVHTAHAATALARAGVLVPWSPRVHVGSTARRLEGLQRVDENALQALPSESLAHLRDAGALGLAYAQLLSTEQIRILQNQVHMRRNEQASTPAIEDMLGTPGDEQQFDWGALSANDDPPNTD